MNHQDKSALEIDDPALAETLRHFKQSVDAWSNAAYGRTRSAEPRVGYRWRLAASWALGAALAFGCFAGAAYEYFHSQQLNTSAALKSAEQKAAQQRLSRVEKLAAEEHAIERQVAADKANAAPTAAPENNQSLMATLDSDVSREVPAAMEPLAQLMDSTGTENIGSYDGTK